jgi:BASS family bile acid:Na+ symporter
MDIDLIKVNFSPDQLVFLNVCLAFIMFGVALDIRLSDFRRLLQKPRAPLVGMLSEYILLPLITLLLIALFDPAPSLAMGMLLVAVCPGGNVSNFMVHLSKGNAALSVMLTSVSTLAAVILTPITFAFWSSMVPQVAELRSSIFVDPFSMVETIITLILVPVALGMSVRARFPSIAEAIYRPVKWLSIAIFLGFVVFAVRGNWDNILQFLHLVFFIVLAHNGLSLLGGYSLGKLFRLKETDARAVSIETGIQNSGLGLILVFNFFGGIGGMAMILAWWGVWHLISGMGLAWFWSYRPPRS